MKIPLGSCDTGPEAHTFPYGPTGGLKGSLETPRSAAAGQPGNTPQGCRSLGCALQHLLSLPWITEELKFSGQEFDLHRHGFILLAVNAEGALSSLRKNQSAVAGLETLGAGRTQTRVSHLLTSYDYEISFADSVRLNANVHKVLFAHQVKLGVSGCDGQFNGGQLYIFPDLRAHLPGEGCGNPSDIGQCFY